MKSTIQSRSGNEPRWGDTLNVHEALQRLGNDEELLKDIFQIYLEDSPAIVEKLHAAVADADAVALQRAAHNLKGLAATLSAAEVVGVASQLEHMAVSHNLNDAAAAVCDLDQRVTELNDAVQHFLQGK